VHEAEGIGFGSDLERFFYGPDDPELERAVTSTKPTLPGPRYDTVDIWSWIQNHVDENGKFEIMLKDSLRSGSHEIT
jgi:hypothetical protein